MTPATRRKLDEVCASYGPQAHRCGLFSCQEDGECAFPNACVVAMSDLSQDAAIERIVSFDERLWREEGRENGWRAPPRRSWPYRMPMIRHVSALWLSWRVHAYAGEWASVGIGIGGPNPYDLWCVEGAWHGYW